MGCGGRRPRRAGEEEKEEDTGPGQRPGTKEDSHTTSHAHTNTEHDFPARGIHKGLTPPTSDIHTLLCMPGAVTMPRGLPHACAFTEPAHILFHHLRNGLSFTGAYSYKHKHACTRTCTHMNAHVHTCMHLYIDACIYTCISTYTSIYMRSFLCVHLYMYL